jgi:hypothetical protein
MRRRNWRIVIVGAVMVGLAVAFFVGMGAMAPQSNDPVALMQTVGMVSGVAAAIGIVMAAVGLIGRVA